MVATDDGGIADAVRAHGGEAVMTRADHPSGSDRIFEALERLDPKAEVETVINLQGDLPTIPPQDIRAVAAWNCCTTAAASRAAAATGPEAVDLPPPQPATTSANPSRTAANRVCTGRG